MKTMTEFPGVLIRMIVAKQKELTKETPLEPEALSQAISDSFKITGDRLQHLMTCLEMLPDPLERLLRFRVLSGESTEMPKGCVQKGDYFFHSDLLILPKKERPSKGHPRDNKGKKGRGKGRGRRDKNASGDREHRTNSQSQEDGLTPNANRRNRKPRNQAGPQREKKPRVLATPTGVEFLPKKPEASQPPQNPPTTTPVESEKMGATE